MSEIFLSLRFVFLQIVRGHWSMFIMYEDHTTAGNGNAGSWTYLPSWLLCLSSLPLQILCGWQVLPPFQHCSLWSGLLWPVELFQSIASSHLKSAQLEHTSVPTCRSAFSVVKEDIKFAQSNQETNEPVRAKLSYYYAISLIGAFVARHL